MGSLHTYCVTNLINNKKYYGKTSMHPPEKRWQRHLATVRKGPDDHHRFQYLHRAIRKYGPEKFTFQVVGTYDNESEWTQAEIDLIAEHHTRDRDKGYNLTAGGDGVLGYRHTARAKRRMSDAKIGVYEGENNPFYGRRHSARVRKIISEKAAKRTGKRNSFYGRRHSEESRTNMREHHYDKERYLSTEQVNEARNLFLGGQTHASLALKYGVTIYVIKNAILGKRAYANIGQQLPRAQGARVRRLAKPPRHTLSPQQVADVRRKYRTGKYTYAELAKPLGVKPSLIVGAVGGHGSYADIDCTEPPIRHDICAPLADDKVQEVRDLYATGNHKYVELAEQFGVTMTVVRNAINGRGRYGKIGTPLPRGESGRWLKKVK